MVFLSRFDKPLIRLPVFIQYTKDMCNIESRTPIQDTKKSKEDYIDPILITANIPTDWFRVF